MRSKKMKKTFVILLFLTKIMAQTQNIKTYIVPNMELVVQNKNMSCWYASGQMLIEWRRRTKRMTEMAHPSPSQVARWKSCYIANRGIGNQDILKYAKDIGLKAIAPMSPKPKSIYKWLKQYGPLWVNGKFHITVIAGIRQKNNKIEILVYDPAKPSHVNGEWRSLYRWYIKNSHSGRDSHSLVRAIFLYVPK